MAYRIAALKRRAKQASIACNICVLYTANDAYMRDTNLVVPSDCTAFKEMADNDYTLQQMRKILTADVTPSEEIDLEVLKRWTADEGVPQNPSRQFADWQSKPA